MPEATDSGPGADRFQAYFHRRWRHLNDPHVRSLAWLLDAPDLLDAQAPQWRGKIATLGPVSPEMADWLQELDHAPDRLIAYLGLQPFTRLGRYAEKLMAFYFESRKTLFAHGLQVRSAKNQTIGEFDFLLRQSEGLVHWEFASKFYLLEQSGGTQADDFVGPNLADTLGAKMRKIMEQQLSLSRHPAAQALLPEPIARAQALVKGWLFYYGQTPVNVASLVAHPHCRGFWRPLSELEAVQAEHYLVLPRLLWLAPVKSAGQDCMDRQGLRDALVARFQNDGMPVMVAILEARGNELVEVDRGFFVPGDWPARAQARASAQ